MKLNHDRLIIDNLKSLVEKLQKAVKNLNGMREFSIIGKFIIAFYEQSQQNNRSNDLKCIYDYFDTTFKNDIVLILKKDGQEHLLTRKDVATVFRAYNTHYTTNINTSKYGVLKEYILESNVECLWYEGIMHAASPEQILYHNGKNDTRHPIRDIKISIEGARTIMEYPSIVERVLLGIYFDVMQIYNSKPRNTSKTIIMFQSGSNLDFVQSDTLNKLMSQYLAYPNICKESFLLPYRIKETLERDGYRIIEKQASNFTEMYKEKELILKWNVDKVIFYSEKNNLFTQ